MYYTHTTICYVVVILDNKILERLTNSLVGKVRG